MTDQDKIIDILEKNLEIKPLEWKTEEYCFSADTPFGRFDVFDLGENWGKDRWEVYLNDVLLGRRCNDEDAALLIAETYVSKIVSIFDLKGN